MDLLEHLIGPTAVIGVPLAIAVGLAFPAWLAARSWRTLLRATAVALFGIIVPGAVFLLSAFLQPEWKGGCRFGWIDCFHQGKLVLLPMILWASAAFYLTDVLRLARASAWTWVRWGLCNGAVASAVCLAQGLLTAGNTNARDFWWGFLVPAGTTAWYAYRTWRVWRTVPDPDVQAGYALLASLPFWIGSVLTSRWLYQQLPEQKPDCFVVTAASRGHPWLVGTCGCESRGGCLEPVNEQLRTFRTFEAVWEKRAPASHRRFRCCYNIWGYRAALLIRRPLLADLAYLLLKPAEWGARLLLSFLNPEP
jgi:hypothetical protein